MYEDRAEEKMKKSYDILWAIISALIIIFIITTSYDIYLEKDHYRRIVVSTDFHSKKKIFYLMQDAKNMNDIKKIFPYDKMETIVVNDSKYYRNRSEKCYYLNRYYFDDNVISLSNKENDTVFIVNKNDKIRFKSSKHHIIYKNKAIKYKKVEWGDKVKDIKDTKYILINENRIYTYVLSIWFCDKDRNVIDFLVFY